MQTPVFLTEPPQMQVSPTPRRRKKRSRRRALASDSRTGWDSGRESGRDSPRSMDLTVTQKKSTRVSTDRSLKCQELDLTVVPEKTLRSERPSRGQETYRSSGDDPLKQAPNMLADVRAGLQKAYMDGVEFMRKKISETQEELDKVKLSFYQCDDNDEEKYEEFLGNCNEKFLQANNELRRKNVKLQVVDSEIQLVALINQMREALEYDKGEIQFVSEFWENIKNTMESLRILVNKFKSSVMDRLRGNCISYSNADIHLEVAARYTEEITAYLAELERTTNDTQILMKSFANGIHQDLFKHTKFTEGILVQCDLKAFPVLRLFPDLTEKIESMCALAHKWLDRDERYMYEVHDYIRETRSMAKKRVDDLRTQKEKRKKYEKAVKAANILLHNNKEKLQKLEDDLNQLETTLNVYKREMESKYGEKTQKESMVDFLKLTLSQTKKNYNLQMKRQRLLKQVKDLEEFLSSLERDLSNVHDKIQEKSQQKDMLVDKVENSEKSYGELKTSLDKFSQNLESLEQEVNSLSGQLLQLEIIQTFKSSPENLDGVYDRPQSVKLAPSLKEKIKKKRKVLAPVR